MDSENVGRSYHIYVRLPEDYRTTDKNYAAVYLLDGDISFPILGAYHLLLHYDEPVPEAIVVGISYGTFDRNNGNFRSTDYSTPPLEDGNLEGGAAAYQQFLADELIPEIETRYKADPARLSIITSVRSPACSTWKSPCITFNDPSKNVAIFTKAARISVCPRARYPGRTTRIASSV